MTKIYSSASSYYRVRFMLFVSVFLLLLIGISLIHGKFFYEQASGHHFWLNVFMVNVTFMGDAWFAVCLSAWLYYQKNPAWKLVMVSTIICVGLGQLIGNLLSGGPFELIVEQGQYLFFIDRAEHLANPGLVSGHTAIAFVLGAGLSAYTKNLQKVCLYSLLFTLVAFSRLYLSGQGWTALMGGALTGLSASLITVYLLKWLADGWPWVARFRKYGKPDRGQMAGPALGV